MWEGLLLIKRAGKGWVIKLQLTHKNAVRWKHGGTYVSSVHSLQVCVQYVHRGGLHHSLTHQGPAQSGARPRWLRFSITVDQTRTTTQGHHCRTVCGMEWRASMGMVWYGIWWCEGGLPTSRLSQPLQTVAQ